MCNIHLLHPGMRAVKSCCTKNSFEELDLGRKPKGGGEIAVGAIPAELEEDV